jgi:hypothetical protein
MVLDAGSQTEIGTISVPGAYSIDDTLDHSLLYVGTLIGDVYAVDPVTMTVTRRYTGSQIGPHGYFAFSALVLADGRLALLGEAGGLPSVDAPTSFAIWGPSDNSFVLYGATWQTSGIPINCGLMAFSRSVDRKKVIFTSGGNLCEVDETTGQSIYASTPTSFLYRITISPDGKYIALPGYPGNAYIYDTQTLNLVSQFAVNGETGSGSAFF